MYVCEITNLILIHNFKKFLNFCMRTFSIQFIQYFTYLLRCSRHLVCGVLLGAYMICVAKLHTIIFIIDLFVQICVRYEYLLIYEERRCSEL